MAFDKTAFGNRLAQLRNSAGLSQFAAGRMLDVSDKAVSKWERGASFPSMETMVKISELYHVSMSELFDAAETKDKRIVRMVLTGGPCAGKSTAISWLMADMQKRGWKVLFAPEVATELITAGITRETFGNMVDFQRAVFQMQLAKERVYEQMAESLPASKVLLVFDRGLMDGAAYLNATQFQGLLRQAGLTEVQARDRYDLVVHLVTAAKGAREHYKTSNNAARKETAQEAASIDNRLIEAWTGHPRHRIITNRYGFEAKMKRMLAEVTNTLGEPGPAKHMRKFLIEMPNLIALENLPECTKIETVQTYLKSEPGTEARVRQRGSDGDYLYTKTIKENAEPGVTLRRILLEKRLSETEYLTELMNADPGLSPVRKDRYCFTVDERRMQIDVFPFWNDKAVLEYPLARADEKVRIPKTFTVIEEVTDNAAYRNHAYAKLETQGK